MVVCEFFDVDGYGTGRRGREVVELVAMEVYGGESVAVKET